MFIVAPSRRAVATALALTVAAALATGAVVALPTRAQTPLPSKSSCVAIQSLAGPARLALVGSTYEVTSTVTTLCAGEVGLVNVVLVLDGSSSMAGTLSTDVKRSARELIDRLDLKDHPGTSIGVVEINQPSKVLCQLTNRASQASGCVGRVGASGGSDIAGALRLALDALRRGRDLAGEGSPVHEAIVVVADGANSGGCDELLRTADEIKGQGVALFTVCATSDCAVSCFGTMATSPAHAFTLAAFRGVIDGIEAFQRRFLNVVIDGIAITETLGPAVELVPALVKPAPAANDGRTLAWQLAGIPKEGTTITLGVRTVAAGVDLPVLTTAVGTFVDSRGRGGEFNFRLPHVDALDARTGIAPTPVADTTPLTNVLRVDATSVIVGERFRASYRLRLPDGDGLRLKLTVVSLRVPDHLRVVRTWRDGRPEGQPDWDPRTAWWSIIGVDPIAPDALDLEAELVATGPGDGGIGIMAYGWSGTDAIRPIAAAVSAPIHVAEQPATPVPPATLPTATVTPRAFRLYLPLALSEACLAGPPNDVVAVIDTSTSMAERLTGGGTKQAAAALALAALVERLDARRDRIALVTFDRTALVRRPLGSVGPGVVDALRDAPLADGTAMGAGLLSAGAVLASPDRRPDARGAVVLLTDGRSSPDAPEAAVAAADALRAAGAAVFAVGLGAEVDRPALDGIAGGRGEARVVGDAATLGVAFGGIGARLGCRATGSWGGRVE